MTAGLAGPVSVPSTHLLTAGDLVLPAAHRMRRGEDFTVTTRRGRRARAGAVVLHHLPGTGTVPVSPPMVGFVIGKAVGNSVVRHRVSRRLRAQTVPLLAGLAPGSRTVVRALPAAADADSASLRRDLDAARRRLHGTAR